MLGKFFVIISIVAATLTFYIQANAETCARMCDPKRSKPCGGGCIQLDANCHKDWTTSCVGVRKSAGKPIYANPTKVDKPPTN